MSNQRVDLFGFSVVVDVEKWSTRVDEFCCDVCDYPGADQWLDRTWVCDDCYQELTLQLSRQHNYTVEWESDE